MAFNKKELKRRAWTEEEKKITMKNCANRCACCGKKLTFKSLTMEHVVPFSKGGENKIENLVALCFDCNRAKANLLYLPTAFYLSLNSSHLFTISEYFKEWFKETFTKDDLLEKPLLYEGLSTYITIEGIKTPSFKNGVIAPSLVMDIFEVNSSDLRDLTKGLSITQKDIFNNVVDKDRLFALYAAKQRASDTISALFTMQLLEDDSIAITEIYSKSHKSISSICSLLVSVNSQYYKDNGIRNLHFRFKSEKSMNDLYGLLYRGVFRIAYGESIPNFKIGKGEQTETRYNDKIIKSDYSVIVLFEDVLNDTITDIKNQLRN